MKIELEIDLNEPKKVAAFIMFLQSVNGAVLGTVETTLEEPVKETSVKATRPKKTVEKPAVEETKEAEKPAVEETKEVEGEKITIEQIREAFATKVNNGDNRLILKTELSRLGAENLSKLDPSKYEEFLKFIENVQ